MTTIDKLRAATTLPDGTRKRGAVSRIAEWLGCSRMTVTFLLRGQDAHGHPWRIKKTGKACEKRIRAMLRQKIDLAPMKPGRKTKCQKQSK